MARKEFRMNEEQYTALMAAMKEAAGSRVMFLSGGIPMFDSPQEIANRAWKKLADEMWFVWDSAGPGSDDHSFTAEALEGQEK
jgi:hypothetical protein